MQATDVPIYIELPSLRRRLLYVIAGFMILYYHLFLAQTDVYNTVSTPPFTLASSSFSSALVHSRHTYTYDPLRGMCRAQVLGRRHRAAEVPLHSSPSYYVEVNPFINTNCYRMSTVANFEHVMNHTVQEHERKRHEAISRRGAISNLVPGIDYFPRSPHNESGDPLCQNSWGSVYLNRSHHFVPLLQYHHRLPLYSLYAHAVFLKGRELEQHKYRLWQVSASGGGGAHKKGKLFSKGEDTTALLSQRRHALDLHYRRACFTTYVQRLMMRAHRHADAMRLETLHFLEYLKLGLPELQPVWRGDDMCRWVGVHCTTVQLPVAELIDVQEPVVQRYFDFLNQVERHPERRKMENHDNLPNFNATQQQAELYRNLSRTIFSRRGGGRHYYLRHARRSLGRTVTPGVEANVGPIDRTPNNSVYFQDFAAGEYVLDMEYIDVNSRAAKGEAKLYICSDGFVNSYGEATAEDASERCDEDSVAAFYRDHEKGMRDGGVQGVLVRETAPVLIPVTLVELDFRAFNLHGTLLQFAVGNRFDVMIDRINKTHLDSLVRHFRASASGGKVSKASMEQEEKEQGEQEKEGEKKNGGAPLYIASPRHRLYFPDKFTEFTPVSADTGHYPLSTRIVIDEFRAVLRHLAVAGRRTQHFDLGLYFAEVATRARFWGEQLEVPDAEAPNASYTKYRRSALHATHPFEATEFLHAGELPAVEHIDDNAFMGDIRTRLLGIHKIDFSVNPYLIGLVHPMLWEAPFLEVLHGNFGSLWPMDNSTDARARASLVEMTQYILRGDANLNDMQKRQKYENLPQFVHAGYPYQNMTVVSHAYTTRTNLAAAVSLLKRMGMDYTSAKAIDKRNFSFLQSEIHDMSTTLYDRAALRQEKRDVNGQLVDGHEDDVYNKLPSFFQVATTVPPLWTWHTFSKMTFREAMRTWYQLYFILTA